MENVCKESQCTGCMACLEVCTKNAIEIRDTLRNYNAVIDPAKCIKCGACQRICQNNNIINAEKPIAWFQGWAKSAKQRAVSSSGGFAVTLAKHFVNRGGLVCSCVFSEGSFHFEFAENENEVERFTGSKYVKSNPQGIYKKIKWCLQEDREVLFIGLPCQVAAVKIFAGERLLKKLYLVDLICHGSPSPKNIEQFLSEAGYHLAELIQVGFRKKDVFRVTGNEHYVDSPGVYDCYSLAFLNCINYTENCYSCCFAKSERVSDITIGDSWGSNLSQEEQDKGISLALCQTDKGKRLLQDAEVELFPVDLENAIEYNHQLERPSVKPDSYDEFFDALQTGTSYCKAVKKGLPRTYRNQQIKKILLKLRFIRGGVVYRNSYEVRVKTQTERIRRIR